MHVVQYICAHTGKSYYYHNGTLKTCCRTANKEFNEDYVMLIYMSLCFSLHRVYTIVLLKSFLTTSTSDARLTIILSDLEA